MEDFEQLKSEIESRVTKRKVAAFDKAVVMQSQLERLQRFIKWFRNKSHRVERLFQDNNPWEIRIDEGEYGNPGITFNLDNKVGIIEMDAEFRMQMIEKILSSINYWFNSSRYNDTPATDWEIVSKDEYSLRFRKKIEFEDFEFDVDIYSYGKNETCQTVKKEVWKKVTEYEVDCGMEKDSDEPAPFIGADGQPVD